MTTTRLGPGPSSREPGPKSTALDAVTITMSLYSCDCGSTVLVEGGGRPPGWSLAGEPPQWKCKPRCGGPLRKGARSHRTVRSRSNRSPRLSRGAPGGST